MQDRRLHTYGSIIYTWNNLGQKTSMTVPRGVSNQAKKTEYYYDRTGKMVGMNVVDAPADSSTTLETGTASETKFWYDDNQNRVKMVTTNDPTNMRDGTYYFVYDPTASIPDSTNADGCQPIADSRQLKTEH